MIPRTNVSYIRSIEFIVLKIMPYHLSMSSKVGMGFSQDLLWNDDDDDG